MDVLVIGAVFAVSFVAVVTATRGVLSFTLRVMSIAASSESTRIDA